MLKKIILFLPIVLLLLTACEKKQPREINRLSEKPFVIVIPSYNNTKYCEQNLVSVLGQEYENFRVIYIDDASTDDTREKIQTLIDRSPAKNKVTLITREKNCGSLYNLNEVIRTCADHEIILRVDGDDFLAHPLVLKKLNRIYQNKNVWMAYGNYLDYPTYKQTPKLCAPFPTSVIKGRHFRQYKWVSSHPQTFYAGLFKKIAVKDLMKDGEFLPMAGDMAIIIPMLEMAADHVLHIQDVLYLYNRINPISDHRKNLKLQSICERHVRSLKTYPRLEKPPYE